MKKIIGCMQVDDTSVLYLCIFELNKSCLLLKMLNFYSLSQSPKKATIQKLYLGVCMDKGFTATFSTAGTSTRKMSCCPHKAEAKWQAPLPKQHFTLPLDTSSLYILLLCWSRRLNIVLPSCFSSTLINLKLSCSFLKK